MIQESGYNDMGKMKRQEDQDILDRCFAFTRELLFGSVVVYFIISNLYRIAQQAYITRSLPVAWRAPRY